VVRYARRAAHELTMRGVKALVLACNTVSAVALEILRAELDMPVLGVVEPGASAAVEAALALGEAGQAILPRIGVLGTAGTIRSGAYPRAVAVLSTRLEVLSEPAPLLVPLVEEGWLEGQVPELAVERYVAPLIDGGAGVLVLGCTHYPLLEPVFRRVSERLASRPPTIVDSAKATADVVRSWVDSGKILRATERTGSLTILVTDQPAGFQRVADLFLGEHSPRVEQIDLATDPVLTPKLASRTTG
jgi:glutamate racemase